MISFHAPKSAEKSVCTYYMYRLSIWCIKNAKIQSKMAEEKSTVVKRKRRRTTRRRSVVDSAVRNAAALSDGCNPELVRGAEFDGVFDNSIQRSTSGAL